MYQNKDFVILTVFNAKDSCSCNGMCAVCHLCVSLKLPYFVAT